MIPQINAAKSSFKALWEIGKGLRALSKKYEQAELQMEIANLMEALATAKMDFAELHDKVLELRDQNSELKAKLRFSGEVVKFREVYYPKDDDGKPNGRPFCSKCFECESILVSLIWTKFNQPPYWRRDCPNCKASFTKVQCPTMVHGEEAGTEAEGAQEY